MKNPATSLTSTPLTDTELVELAELQGATKWHRGSAHFMKAVGGMIKPFNGEDLPLDLATWRNTCALYFDSHSVHDTAVQAAMAALALRDDAANWWIGHRQLNRNRCLSFAQLHELLQIELVPAAYAGTSEQQWSRLEYNSNLEEYFKTVRTLMRYNPLPGISAHVMAARPFGKAFEDKIIVLANNAGPRGLTPAQFEANVRAYVQEMEQKPGILWLGEKAIWNLATAEPSTMDVGKWR